MTGPLPLAADPMAPQIVRVRRRVGEYPGVVTLDIEPPACGYAFAPGQFNMLYAFGIGEAAISVSGDPRKPGRILHTVRAVGATSRALTSMRKGAELGLRGPYGTPWPLAAVKGRDVILMAGGLGLAPLRPALYALLADRKAYGRVALLFGTRSPDTILFQRELERWAAGKCIDVHVTVDHAEPGWAGHVGVVSALLDRLSPDPERTAAFLCGPEVMMRFSATALCERGFSPQSIWLSMERNMKCAIGFCGHCQFGPDFVCREGPVFPYDRIREPLHTREL